jgi:hypothetical protein
MKRRATEFYQIAPDVPKKEVRELMASLREEYRAHPALAERHIELTLERRQRLLDQK